MKLKFSLIAIALLGLMAAMPAVGHASEPAPQPEIRVLTDQEMQEVTGAGKACDTPSGCQAPCRANSIGGSYELIADSAFYVCNGSIFPTTCPTATYECGHWVTSASPCASRGTRSRAGFETGVGCDGVTPPAGAAGYTGVK